MELVGGTKCTQLGFVCGGSVSTQGGRGSCCGLVDRVGPGCWLSWSEHAGVVRLPTWGPACLPVLCNGGWICRGALPGHQATACSTSTHVRCPKGRTRLAAQLHLSFQPPGQLPCTFVCPATWLGVSLFCWASPCPSVAKHLPSGGTMAAALGQARHHR